jgi:hypothetical protein
MITRSASQNCDVVNVHNELPRFAQLTAEPMPQNSFDWPVDGHVHFHTLERVAPTLDAAVTNFRAMSRSCDGPLGALLLTQTMNERVFEALLASAEVPGWSFVPVQDEPQTLIARRGQATVVVVCGRQVRTVDGLEVLALGTRDEFPDGLTLAEAVAAVQQSGALTVLPWAFGKWLGNRGRRVAAMLETSGVGAIYLGDNGGRARLLGVPALIRTSEKKGFHVLSGSDPLPIAGEYRRVGGFGFRAGVSVPETAPWRSLRAWLLAQRASPEPYGRACGPVRFVFNQVALRLGGRESQPGYEK